MEIKNKGYKDIRLNREETASTISMLNNSASAASNPICEPESAAALTLTAVSPESSGDKSQTICLQRY